MRSLLASLAVLVVPVPLDAQSPCGLPGVTVTVSPRVAAPGQLVQVTLTNGSSQEIDLTSSCCFQSVHPDAACSTAPVFTPFCLAVIVSIQPGQSYTTTWNQRDDSGFQVPDGSYSFTIRYWDAGFTTLMSCCAQLDVTGSCGTAGAASRNGSGVNPLTLASVNPPVLGASWDTTLDCSAHAPGQAVLFVYGSPASGPLTPYGEVLVGGTRLLRRAQAHAGSTAPFSEPVPPDLALCGLQAYSQGLCLGAPGPQLSSALDLVLGF